MRKTAALDMFFTDSENHVKDGVVDKRALQVEVQGSRDRNGVEGLNERGARRERGTWCGLGGEDTRKLMGASRQGQRKDHRSDLELVTRELWRIQEKGTLRQGKVFEVAGGRMFPHRCSKCEMRNEVPLRLRSGANSGDSGDRTISSVKGGMHAREEEFAGMLAQAAQKKDTVMARDKGVNGKQKSEAVVRRTGSER